MMKKLFAILLALGILVSAIGCASDEATANMSGDTATTDSADTGEEIKVAVLLSATGELDDHAFTSAVWEAVEPYCQERNIPYTYYKPSENTVEMQVAVCDAAVAAGAEFIVVISDQYKVALLEMSETYPDVKFLGIECKPQNTDGEITIHDNVKTVTFAAEQSGFLAGYASVKEGFKNLGIMGGKQVPGVIQYCYGFVAGAEAAAQEFDYDDVNLKYTYWGENSATPEHQAQAAAWYQSGTELIFVVAGPGNSSVFAAAEQNDGIVVGCDSDQSYFSDTVITSALKGVGEVTTMSLEEWNTDTFDGGEIHHMSAADGAVGLAMETAKFEHFTQEDYDSIYQKLAENKDGFADSIPNDLNCASPLDIPVSKLHFEFIQ